MSKQLEINATNARKNFFGILDQVIKDDLKVKITKEGLSGSVLISKQKTAKEVDNVKAQLALVKSTAGSIKSSGYKENEMELAEKSFVSEFKE